MMKEGMMHLNSKQVEIAFCVFFVDKEKFPHIIFQYYM